MSTAWLPLDPFVMLTKPLEQLNKLAVHAGIPHADQQTLEKALAIVRSTRDFEYALTLWESKLDQDKTWDNFKTHFHVE